MGKAIFWAIEMIGEALIGWGIGTVVSDHLSPKSHSKLDKVAVHGTSVICTWLLCRKWYDELLEVFDGLGAFDK